MKKKTEKRDKDKALIICKGCVCVPKEYKNISQKTNKNSEFEYTPGVGDGQGGLACSSSWGRKESDSTVTELN